ncbi:hypothetical protein CLAIMM_09394 [Cladophialophora immunda]|nr:hypothetical protein CLAIMM_09394 [Cladophialophora immunda]
MCVPETLGPTFVPEYEQPWIFSIFPCVNGRTPDEVNHPQSLPKAPVERMKLRGGQEHKIPYNKTDLYQLVLAKPLTPAPGSTCVLTMSIPSHSMTAEIRKNYIA